MKATREQLTSSARAVALEASVNAGRIQPALIALDDASGSLRAAGGGRGGDRPDPTFGAVGKLDEAAKDRNRVEHIVSQMLTLSKELSGILASWNPDAARQRELRGVKVTNEAMWCVNHAAHGMDETCRPGGRVCEFCDSFDARDDVRAIVKARKLDKDGKLFPNRWLLDVRSRRMINSADIAKATHDIIDDRLADKAARKAERKAEREAEKATATRSTKPQGA